MKQDRLHVLITGADGFVGSALARRLATSGAIGGRSIAHLSLVDRRFGGALSARQDGGRRTGGDVGAPSSAGVPDLALACDVSVSRHVGSFADQRLLQQVGEHGRVDVVFHLASMPGSAAERDQAGGVRTNLLDAVALLEWLAASAPMTSGEHTPAPNAGQATRVVFASSIAVYGSNGFGRASENDVPSPLLTYGAHKWMTEIALADHSRRGTLDGVSLRLPGLVARPPAESGHGSAFMSLLFHRIAQGVPYTCPVSDRATAWWMSLERCVDNLVHAAAIDTAPIGAHRTVQLPVLHLAVGDLVDALRRRSGRSGPSLVTYAPDPLLERIFGRSPPLDAPRAQALGFRSDADAANLIDAVYRMIEGDGRTP